MQIHVSTDRNLEGHEGLTRHVEASLKAGLARFREGITSIEVRLSDENAAKSGNADKRCVIEARPAGRNPVAVSDNRATIEEAVEGATRKLRRLLDSAQGRSNDHKGGASIRMDEDIE